MKRDQWTEQLHDKLAEYETAAPDDLWADIEAALDQQPALAQSAPAQPTKPARSRFVAMRRWAVAASIAVLLLGGGYLWWTASEQSQQAAQSLSSAQGEDLLTQQLPSPQGEDLLAQQLPAPQGEGQGVGAETYSDRSPENSSEGVIQTPPLTPPLEGRGVAAREEPQRLIAENSQRQTIEETQTIDEPQRQIAEEPQRQIAEESQRQIMDLQQWEDTERPVAKPKRQMSLGLYAMNGFDNQNSSNGVLMADALAKQYMETYANSYSARSSEPIWLAGYEERQHHHRPITYGLTVDYPFSDRLSLNTGVVYTKLQSDFTQVMRSQQIQQEQTLHYVGIPLGLSYRLWSYRSIRTYLSGGMKADWNVATHLETEGVSQELPKDRMQWSFNVSVGVQYDILPQLGCYLEPSLNWYPDNGSKLQNYFKDKPLNLGLQIGLRLNLR